MAKDITIIMMDGRLEFTLPGPMSKKEIKTFKDKVAKKIYSNIKKLDKDQSP